MAPLTFVLYLVASLLTLPTLIHAAKTAFFPNFSALDAQSPRKPPFASSPAIVTFLGVGKYPSFCYSTSNAAKASDDPRKNCAISSLQVYTVAYNDCPSIPWTVCRCADAQLSMEQMVIAFGRVPPGIRSGVVHVFVLDGSRPDGSIRSSGGSNNDRFVIRGPIADAAFAHESFHSTDKGFSCSAAFMNAYNADASPAEDFAQLGVFVDYDTNGTPISSYVSKEQSCMRNQLDAVRMYAGDKINLATSRCFARRPNDGNVTGSAFDEPPTTAPIVWEFEDHWN
ncbi:hypothetical protein CC80DRAFT_582482 [Byssothecium circinans]|uniref:Uncharacterized protein n=1 Tax=Byssothecium circinans TaxID=147558 RepID=A0A6A5U623_9PLEO|nr:hypothetical protein CC80DRAFT_582482 [Byssothecium circinans]